MPDAIFFDVDGVLIDSMEIKGNAFAIAFDDHPELRDDIIALHYANAGVTRSEKIALILREVLGVEPSPEAIQARVAAFGEAVVTAVIAAPEILGAGDAVAKWAEVCELHAVSATPNEELGRIFAGRNLTSSFTSISGWPPAKSVLIDSIVRRRGLDRSRCILVGDSREDHAAAQSNGLAFIQVRAAGEADFTVGGEAIADLRELDRAINRVLRLPAQ